MCKLLVKDILDKVTYKATIRTYAMGTNYDSQGRCLQEGYSSDLKDCIFSECEVESISYDYYRKRVAIEVNVESAKRLLVIKSPKELAMYLGWYKGYSNMRDYNDSTVKEQLESEVRMIKEAFIKTIDSGNYNPHDE